MSPDAFIAAVARDQHGLVTRTQARAAGLTGDQIEDRVARGRWDPLYRSVYRIAGTPSSREQRCLAACLAAGEGAVVSHRSAAELWGLDGVEPGWSEVTVTTSHHPRHVGFLVHRTRDLRPTHTTVRHGLPITNPMRTLVDLGAVCPRPVVGQAMDDALGRKLVSIKGLVQVWRDVARPGRNGSGVLRALLEEHLPFPNASRLEKAMLRLHRNHGLPEPEAEVEIRDEQGRFIGRVDYAHRAARIVIEVDGYDKRTSKEAFVRDRVRDRRLRAMGWTVLRFVWFEVIFTPAEVAAEIRPFLLVSVAR